MVGMFASHQKFFAVPLVMYEHDMYEVSRLYNIGKLAFQNFRTPVFQEIPVR